MLPVQTDVSDGGIVRQSSSKSVWWTWRMFGPNYVIGAKRRSGLVATHGKRTSPFLRPVREKYSIELLAFAKQFSQMATFDPIILISWTSQ